MVLFTSVKKENNHKSLQHVLKFQGERLVWEISKLSSSLQKEVFITHDLTADLWIQTFSFVG